MLNDRKIALIGVGTMGKTLARGLLSSGAAAAENLCGSVAHAERAAERSGEVGIDVGHDNAAAARISDAIVLCVKPRGAVAVI